MNLAQIVPVVNGVWILLEVLLIVSARWNRRTALPRDRGSRILLWVVIGASIGAATALQGVARAQIQMPERWWLGASLLLLVSGLIVRWTAILTLGRFFSTHVAIQPDHQLVRAGLYRVVRHPSYTGLFLMMIGLGLSFGNWLSLGAIVVPFLAVLLYRIRVEETILQQTLGPDYAKYCQSTKRLLPGIY